MERAPPLDRRLLDKLVREIARAELQAMEHAPREARRLGDAPPVLALRTVAEHAAAMRPRFLEMIAAHGLPPGRFGIGASLATLRHIVVERVMDPERAFRTALVDLRHGVDIVRLLRETARRRVLFGVIRWCDDWLATRRTLVARAEAQLAWYAEQAGALLVRMPPVEPAESPWGDDDPDDWHIDRRP